MSARKVGDIRRKMRELIQETVEKETPSLTEIPDLEGYLATLKQRAIDAQQVTALEVEPGIQAILALSGKLGPEETHERIATFSQEMSQLSKHFGAVAEEQTPPRGRDMADKLNEIRNESDESFKREAIEEYLNMVHTLPDPEEQSSYLRKLGSTLAVNQK